MTQTAPPPPGPAILSAAEVSRRMLLLSELGAALAALEVRSVLAGNHRLVLRWHSSGPWRQSGQTDPQLYIFTPNGTCVATTDGTTYTLTTGQQIPVGDPADFGTASTRRAFTLAGILTAPDHP